MGRLDVSHANEPEHVRGFTRSLLRDLQVLDQMYADGAIESDVRRIGAEQEVFLVDRGWRPAPVAMEVLQSLDGPCFTTELALFNLEINLPPFVLASGCFDELKSQLDRSIAEVRRAAWAVGADVVLTGILPTLTVSDLSLSNITPRDRYYALNEAMTKMRGGAYRLHIQGADELHLEHDSVMLEACNTSFQVHLQVTPEEFPRVYNIAQAITAPLLAAAANSPLLFARRLWSETRIALFQQSIDTRRNPSPLRELTPRVRFGERWVKGSIVEVYQEDIARVPALVGSVSEENSDDLYRHGTIPKLLALQLYNSTVYRWNRPCYGVYEGKPHLRIECRVLPSGPTVIDEVANMAFWVGMMSGVSAEFHDITNLLSFDDARANLLAAARRGLHAGFTWFDERTVSASELIFELLPVAEAGLKRQGLAEDEITRYLDIIHARVASGGNGSGWLRRSVAALERQGTTGERMAALTAAIARRQATGAPCHEWSLADIEEGGGWRYNYQRVGQYMTTDLFTVKEDELLDLAALIMDWKHIRQVLVEDDERRLVGLVSYSAILRRLFTEGENADRLSVPVKAVMETDPVTVTPETTTREAIALMRAGDVTCLPVLHDGRLVGIVTRDDFLPIAERLFQNSAAEPEA